MLQARDTSLLHQLGCAQRGAAPQNQAPGAAHISSCILQPPGTASPAGTGQGHRRRRRTATPPCHRPVPPQPCTHPAPMSHVPGAEPTLAGGQGCLPKNAAFVGRERACRLVPSCPTPAPQEGPDRGRALPPAPALLLQLPRARTRPAPGTPIPQEVWGQQGARHPQNLIVPLPRRRREPRGTELRPQDSSQR